MEVLNERAFRQLIKMYKSIKFEDLSKCGEETIDLNYFLNGITGFGSIYTCTLCHATIERVCGMIMPANCNKCLYVHTTDNICNYGPNFTTYYNLKNSCCSPEEAIKYIYERIEYMLFVYNDYLHKVINETEIEIKYILATENIDGCESSPYVVKLKRKLKCFNKKLKILNGKGL